MSGRRARHAKATSRGETGTKVRRVVHRVGRVEEQGLDTQFWPVVVALCILASVSLGAILTLLRGPLLWLSLMVLPAGLAASILVLAKIHHRRLRRGLQLALILSLIVHLGFLISAHRVNVFGAWTSQAPTRSSARVTRTIQVPVEMPSRPWEEVNVTETPEVEQPEVDREATTQPVTERPQPTPLDQQQASVAPQQVARRELSRTAPRFSPESSRLSRQSLRAEAQTSRQADTTAAASASASTATDAPAENAATLARQTASAATETPTRRPPVPASDSTPANSAAAPSPQRVEQAAREPAAATAPKLTRQPPARERIQPQSASATDSTAVVTSPPARPQPEAPAVTSSTAELSANHPRPRRASPTPTPAARRDATRAAAPSDSSTTLAQTPQSRPVRREPTPITPARVTPTEPADPSPPRRTLASSTPATTPAETQPTLERLAERTPDSATSPSAVELATSGATPARRRATATPTRIRERQIEPSLQPRTAVNPQPRANPLATREPRIDDPARTARAEQPTSRPRQQVETRIASQDSQADVAESSAPVKASELEVNPSSTDVARQAQSDAAPARTQLAQAEPTESLVRQIPQRSERASPQSTRPSISTNQSSARPRRSLETDPLAASPRPAEAPTVTSQAEGQRTTNAAPEAFAINRGTTGTAGAGQSRNLDRDVAAGERPAITASNSLQRAETTTVEPGQTLQPSQPSRQRQSVADQAIPSSAMAVNTDRGRPTRAAESATGVAAQASATRLESRSPASRDDVAALKGSAEIDLGPPKIVANELAGRGAGGGQPNPTAEESVNPEERSERGSLSAAVASNQQADLPTSPREDGNAEPLTAPESPTANSLARSNPGGSDAVSGEPTASDSIGPADLVSRAETPGVAQLQRAQAADAMPAEPAAGGGFLNDNDEDEEERERRRRLAEASGSSIGSLTAQAPIELPSSDQDEAGSGRQATALAAADAASSASERAAETAGVADRSPSPDARPTPSSAASGASTGPPVETVARARPNFSEGLPGPALPGGGSNERRRRTPRVAIAGEVAVDTATGAGDLNEEASATADVAAAAAEASRISGSRSGVTRAAAGIATSTLVGPAIAGLPPVVLEAPARDEARGPIRSPGLQSEQPRRRPGARANPGAAAEIDLQVAGPGNDAGDGRARSATGQPAASPGAVASDNSGSDTIGPSGNARLQRSRGRGGAVTVEVEVDDGPGGLGERVTPQVGVNDRRARPDAGPVQSFADSRFIRDDPGGRPSFNATASLPAEAFAGRRPRRRGGAPQTEEAIELGLAFLVRHQQPEGHWILETFGTGTGDDEDETPVYRSDTAATGLALLAFQGAGYNHMNYKYAAQLQRAVRWLVEHQAEDGLLYVSEDDESNRYCRLYSHGIATLALCEAYGMTQDPRLREPVQRALDYIVASQDESRGGWRYTPGRSADTSVTGWMMMALKSGQLAGLTVPRETYAGIRRWLEVAQVEGEPHKYVYNPYAANTPQQRHGRQASRPMTAVGLLLELYFGSDRGDRTVRQGADYLLEQLPSQASPAERDTYYWYYATQVLRHVGGERWERWNRQLHPLLIESQVKQPRQLEVTRADGRVEQLEDNSLVGSWDPLTPVPDAWGLAGGRIYVTTLNLLSLEVDYRLLPLYQDTVKEP